MGAKKDNSSSAQIKKEHNSPEKQRISARSLENQKSVKQESIDDNSRTVTKMPKPFDGWSLDLTIDADSMADDYDMPRTPPRISIEESGRIESDSGNAETSAVKRRKL